MLVPAPAGDWDWTSLSEPPSRGAQAVRTRPGPEEPGEHLPRSFRAGRWLTAPGRAVGTADGTWVLQRRALWGEVGVKWVSLASWAASTGHSVSLPGEQVLSVPAAGACHPLTPGRPVCESGHRSEHRTSTAGPGPGMGHSGRRLPPPVIIPEGCRGQRDGRAMLWARGARSTAARARVTRAPGGSCAKLPPAQGLPGGRLVAGDGSEGSWWCRRASRAAVQALGRLPCGWGCFESGRSSQTG